MKYQVPQSWQHRFVMNGPLDSQPQMPGLLRKYPKAPIVPTGWNTVWFWRLRWLEEYTRTGMHGQVAALTMFLHDEAASTRVIYDREFR